MSSLVKAGIDVTVSNDAATLLLDKIRTTIKASGSPILTATVQDSFDTLKSLSSSTADVLNYKVTDKTTIDNINSLVKVNNTVTATIDIAAGDASKLATKSTDEITEM